MFSWEDAFSFYLLYAFTPTTTVSVLLGSTEFSAEELAANYRAVVDDIVSRWCPNGWKDVQSVSLKGVYAIRTPFLHTP